MKCLVILTKVNIHIAKSIFTEKYNIPQIQNLTIPNTNVIIDICKTCQLYLKSLERMQMKNESAPTPPAVLHFFVLPSYSYHIGTYTSPETPAQVGLLFHTAISEYLYNSSVPGRSWFSVHRAEHDMRQLQQTSAAAVNVTFSSFECRSQRLFLLFAKSV